MKLQVILKGTLRQIATLKGKEAERFSEWFNKAKAKDRCRFGLVSYSKESLKVNVTVQAKAA